MTHDFDAKKYLQSLPSKPGIYQMFNKKSELLYVGKARNLKKRLQSYFRENQISVKTRALVSQIAAIEITLTQTENEALLLENATIKEKLPPFNVIFRDDKSYPYLYLSQQHTFPRLTFYRGKSKSIKGNYYGPYPSVMAARLALNILQKAFQIRQCEDAFFNLRSRPCLQHQIKRCTAPCVGLISQADYAQRVAQVRLFLEGKDQQVIDATRGEMELAAVSKHYEIAATLRDRMALLVKVQQGQGIYTDAKDTDVAVIIAEKGYFCVDILTVRAGRLLGHKAYFPKVAYDADAQEVLSSFLAQYYLNNQQTHLIPKQIIVNCEITDKNWLANTLSEVSARQVQLTVTGRGIRARWCEMALDNARIALAMRLQQNSDMQAKFNALQSSLQLLSLPGRLECFDVSHTSGEKTVASCVVFDSNGPRKTDYRRFNIEGITPGDDYAGLKQALIRRYTRLKRGEGVIPDILFIDGGKGQLTQAKAALEECQITGLTLIAIAKGVERKPGKEVLWLNGNEEPLILAADDLALHLIQHIRDEAHRFAIVGHRARRNKGQTQSILETIPGVGEQRRRALLNQFGGLQGVKIASEEELARTPGISKTLAALIYAALH